MLARESCRQLRDVILLFPKRAIPMMNLSLLLLMWRTFAVHCGVHMFSS